MKMVAERVQEGDLKVEAEAWWNINVGDDIHEAHFSLSVFPLLLRQKETFLPPGISVEELLICLTYCLGGEVISNDLLTQKDFMNFVARFGPVNMCLSKALSSVYVNRSFVPWFHGSLSRSDAEKILRNRPDGSFLVRFSESQPKKFTLTYSKVHNRGPNAGKQEFRNCLIRNSGKEGFALWDSPHRHYTSIASFVAASASRLKQPARSELSEECNTALMEARRSLSHVPQRKPFQASVSNQQQHLDKEGMDANGSFTATCIKKNSGPEINMDQDYALFYTSGVQISNQKPPGNLPPQQTPFRISPPYSVDEEYRSFMEIQSKSASISHENTYGSFQQNMVDTSMKSSHSNDSNQYESFSRSTCIVNDSGYGSFASEEVVKHTNWNKIQVDNEYGSFAVESVNRNHTSSSSICDHEYGQFESNITFSDSKVHLPESNQCEYGSFADENQVITSSTKAKAKALDEVYGRFKSLLASSTHINRQITPSEQMASSSNEYSHFGQEEEYSTVEEKLPPPPPPAAPLFPVKASNQKKEPSSFLLPETTALDRLNSGISSYKVKNFKDAVRHLMTAISLARAHGDTMVEARALGNLGTVYLDLKNPHEAVICYEKCLKITRLLKDTKRQKTILNNLVLACIASEDSEKALEYSYIQLEMTTNRLNREKIWSRIDYFLKNNNKSYDNTVNR